MTLIRTPRLRRTEFEEIETCIKYIEENYAEAITAEELSMTYNIKIPKLHWGFKIKTGCTVHGYLLKIRLDAALMLLLDPDELIKSVACNIGFGSHNYFAKVFKRRFGQTPQEYRSNNIPASDL